MHQNESIDSLDSLDSLDFSIEMETGTGKTYVYLRTILELYGSYGWKKFIIVVPSIAIKEGVLSSLCSMEEHFWQELKIRYNYFEYSSERLTELRHFIRDDDLQIMVTTLDGFKRQNTVMQRNDLESFAASPLESLARTKSIVILELKTCFIVETKATELDSELMGIEGAKIKCGKKHFQAIGVLYRQNKKCEDITI